MIGRARIILGLAVSAIPIVSSAAPPVSGEEAASVAQLRTEVETAAETLEAERAAARDELAALRAERAELERQVRAAQTRGATLERLAREATERAEQRDAAAQRWREPMREAIAVARRHVEAGLPFAPAARLAVLAGIERDLAASRPDYARALERLLRFIEEEQALGREVALAQQRLQVAGEPMLVDVVRLAMALLYLRTPDGRYGWAVHDSDGWRVELFTDPMVIAAVERRFASHEANETFDSAELVVPEPLPEGVQENS